MTKRLNRYEKVLSKLPDTLKWSYGQNIDEVRHFMLDDDNLPRIFIGSGGSLSAAHLATQLSVERGIVAAAMTPYQYIFSAWSRLPAKVFAFSAGGRNVDVINAYKTCQSNSSQQFGAMLMSSPSTVENMMHENGNKNIYAFRLENGDGFLATNSLLAFYSLLFRIYRDETATRLEWDYDDSIGKGLNRFIKRTYTLSTEDWNEHDAAIYEARETDRFYVLYSPDTMPMAIDLESRFSEGAVGCLQISDYRNFAHGRFNWFHQRKGQTAIIALVSPESRSVADGILSEIPKDIPIMKLDTALTGTDGSMDLLIKGMYLAKYLGLRWGLDIGAPSVAVFGKIIHKKDFMNANITKTDDILDDENCKRISDSILNLPIPNIARVSGNIIRGETLWASHNRKFLPSVKEAGVEVIIDFRTADFTDKFSEFCAAKGLKYCHIPIDKANVTDEQLLKSLPNLFHLLDDRNCYISCQQGLHRTDIALAIYYMFHRPDTVPTLFGHSKRGTFRCDDIMRRLNSLYSALTGNQVKECGLTVFSENEFRMRRKLLLETNRKKFEVTR